MAGSRMGRLISLASSAAARSRPRGISVVGWAGSGGRGGHDGARNIWRGHVKENIPLNRHGNAGRAMMDMDCAGGGDLVQGDHVALGRLVRSEAVVEARQPNVDAGRNRNGPLGVPNCDKQTFVRANCQRFVNRRQLVTPHVLAISVTRGADHRRNPTPIHS